MRNINAPQAFLDQTPRPILESPRPVDIVQLTTSAQQIAETVNAADFEINALYASNISGAAQTVTLHLVPEGGTVGTGNIIMFQVAVAQNTMGILFDREARLRLAPGQTLHALASNGAAVNIWGQGNDYLGTYS